MSTYSRVYDAPGSVGALPCPGCGATALRLLFRVDALDSAMGMPVFWCDACLRGLGLCHFDVAPGAERVLKSAGVEIPDFELVHGE